MKKINLSIYFLLICCSNFFFINLYSQIDNTIVLKVGDNIVTSIDIQNEIVTNLVLSNKQITQENINKSKNFAIKKMINKNIKKSEIKKYEINDYSSDDLKNYITKVAKSLNTDQKGLKKIFKERNINYEIFVENYKTELLWNTLIFQIYRNQLNINVVEVESEVEKVKQNRTEKELKEIKKNILNSKKAEKLDLFSRSHFSRLENSITVKFL